MDLPLYILDIDENLNDGSSVFAVGFVTMPAIERNYIAFDGTPKRIHFDVIDNEKQLLAGFLMVADQPIYRRDPDTNQEFYVSFPAQSINKIVSKLGRSGKQLSFNYDHNDNTVSKTAYLQQHFIINSEMGINTPKGFETAPDGSWFSIVRIDDKAEFEEAKARGGFSVEGYFNEFKLLDAPEQIYIDIKNKLLQCLN